MGWGQSKEKNTDTHLVAQTVNNNFHEKLDNIAWIVITLAVVICIVVGYAMWHRCRSTAKAWVRKQMVTDPKIVTVQTVPQQQTAAGNSFVKTSGNFMEAMVVGAGHMVPADKPRAAKQIIDRFINRHK